MRALFITIIACLAFQYSNAQQLGITSLYRYNWQILNPAAINHSYLEDERMQYMANASYRSQWSGFEGAPVNYSMRFEYLPDDQNIKVGGFAYGEQAGAIGTNGGFLNFAYLIYLQRSRQTQKFISVGANLGMVNYRVDADQIIFQDPQPGFFGDENNNRWYADMSLGAFYRWESYNPRILQRVPLKQFYLGVSIPQTFTLNFDSPDTLGYTLERVRHYYLMSGAFFVLPGNIILEPSFWMRYAENLQYQTLFDGAPLSADVNVRAEYNNFLWLGTGFSTNRLAHFEAGTVIGRGEYINSPSDYAITLGLAYDMPIGWKNWLGPSFEVSLGVAWD